jgi:hypothetical protein
VVAEIHLPLPLVPRHHQCDRSYKKLRRQANLGTQSIPRR